MSARRTNGSPRPLTIRFSLRTHSISPRTSRACFDIPSAEVAVDHSVSRARTEECRHPCRLSAPTFRRYVSAEPRTGGVSEGRAAGVSAEVTGPSLGAHQRRPPMEPRPQPDEAHQLPRPDPPALAAFIERDGNRRRRRVPVLLDVVVPALVRQPQRLLHPLA